MKYTTFRGIGIGAVVVLAGGAVAFCVHKSASDKPAGTGPPPPAPSAPAMVATSTSTSTSTAPAAQGSTMPLRPMDRDLLARAHEPFSGTKLKDALPGRSYKVDCYRDEGHDAINRCKVDLNRNEKWDEKWTFGPEVKREVAPNDDDVYSEEWRLRDEVWVRKR